jgi:alanyl-tRNA synthetase
VEFCGGTHAGSTGELGLFRILSESSVAAGVRRIEAVTGKYVLELLNRQTALMNETALQLKANTADDIARRAAQVMNELKAAEKSLADMNAEQSAGKVKEMLSNARTVGAVRVITAAVPGVAGDGIRSMCDSCRDTAGEDAVVVLAGVGEGSVTFGCYCAPGAIKAGAHAGNIVREVATICGGKGGGRPDIAMAGGKDVASVDKALNEVDTIVLSILK